MSLRKSLIRLAYQNPELRGDLLPLLKHAGDFVSALDSETIRTIKRSLGNALKALQGAEKPYPDLERGLRELDRLVNSSAGNPRKEKVFFDKVVDLQDLAERHYNSSYDSALSSPYSKSVASSLEYISGFSIDEDGDTFRHLMANYDTGYVDPDGWEPGMVMDLEFSPGEGSALPPARDMKGDPMSEDVTRVAWGYAVNRTPPNIRVPSHWKEVPGRYGLRSWTWDDPRSGLKFRIDENDDGDPNDHISKGYLYGLRAQDPEGNLWSYKGRAKHFGTMEQVAQDAATWWLKGPPSSMAEVFPRKNMFKPSMGNRLAGISRSVLRQFKPGSWFHKFFSEKDIPYRVFDVTDSQGLTHDIPNEVVIEHIAGASKREQEQIKQVLIKIDFHNGDVNHFLEHLAKALAENYSGSMRSASASVQSVKAALGSLAPYFSVYQSTLGGVAVGYGREGAFAGPGAWTKAWKALQGAGFQLRQTKEPGYPSKPIMLVN